MKKYHSKLTYIPPTTKKTIVFNRSECAKENKKTHEEVVNKYNELLINPKVQSIYMEPLDPKGKEWIIEYKVYTKEWLKKYGTRR